MAYDGRNTYQQSQILDADPMRLVILLYRGAIEAVASARAHQRGGQVRQRSEQVTRAFEIVAELAGAVDRDKAGAEGNELGLRLAQLYDYMQHQLNRANVEQIIEPLDEVESLLKNLLEGWEGAQAQLAATAPAAYAQPDRAPLSLSV